MILSLKYITSIYESRFMIILLRSNPKWRQKFKMAANKSYFVEATHQYMKPFDTPLC